MLFLFSKIYKSMVFILYPKLLGTHSIMKPLHSGSFCLDKNVIIRLYRCLLIIIS